MTFEIARGDMWEEKCDYWVIPLNCVGVQGAGVAKEWKKRFPFEERQYMRWRQEHTIRPGRIIIGEDSPFILAFTKDHWKHPSRMGWIENIIANICAGVSELSLINLSDKVIVSPMIGGGYGGLNHRTIERVMGTAFEDAPFHFKLMRPEND